MIALPALSALLAATLSLELVGVNAHGPNAHAHIAQKRQLAAASSAASSAAPATASATSAAAATSAATVSSAAAGTTSAAASAPATTAAAGSAVGTGSYSVPPLESISVGMPSGVIPTLTTTYTPGASPTYLSGAPPLPTKCTSAM